MFIRLIGFWQDVANGKTGGTTKAKTGRPRKNKANKNQSFMHGKDANCMANYQQPTSKELAYIKNGNCFLMRNMRKVREVELTSP